MVVHGSAYTDDESELTTVVCVLLGTSVVGVGVVLVLVGTPHIGSLREQKQFQLQALGNNTFS